MFNRKNYRRMIMIFIIILVISIVHSSTRVTLSIPNMSDSVLYKTQGPRILKVYHSADYRCIPSEPTIHGVEENVRINMNFRAKQNRFEGSTSIILFTIVFAMVLVPYLFFYLIIYLYGRYVIPLWKVIRYIHLFDGEKDDAYILI